MPREFASGSLWAIAFALGAVFQWWRGSNLDSVIYSLIAILLLMALQRKLRIPSIGRPRFTFSAWWLALSSCIFMFTTIHGTASIIASLLLLPILLSIIWQEEEGLKSSSGAVRLTSRFWTLLLLILSLSELGNYFGSDSTGSDIRYPTLTVLIDPIVASTSGRIGFVFLWSLLGIELMRRAIRK